eukprot:1372130-Rhodomonas_salina.1
MKSVPTPPTLLTIHSVTGTPKSNTRNRITVYSLSAQSIRGTGRHQREGEVRRSPSADAGNKGHWRERMGKKKDRQTQ